MDQASSPDDVVVEAAKLAQAASVLRLDPEAKARIRARLSARERRPLPSRLRPILVGLFLVGLIAIAGATAERIWKGNHEARTSLAPELREPERAAAPTSQHDTDAARPPTVTAPELDGSDAIDVREIAPTPPAGRRPYPKTQPAPSSRPERIGSASPAPAAPESVLVLDAMHAMHYEHDATRALGLLDEYLRRFPSGALLEESLALAIEAASARNDKAAASYARTYLTRFPAGRFREAALHAIERFSP
jgi:hypothetical protein